MSQRNCGAAVLLALIAFTGLLVASCSAPKEKIEASPELVQAVAQVDEMISIAVEEGGADKDFQFTLYNHIEALMNEVGKHDSPSHSTGVQVKLDNIGKDLATLIVDAGTLGYNPGPAVLEPLQEEWLPVKEDIEKIFTGFEE